MAKGKLVVNMKLKWWAKPVAFTLYALGLKRFFGKWMFDFKISSE